MTEPMTPDDARARLRLYATCGCKAGSDCAGCIEADKRINAYAASVRAATLAAVRERVEDCEAREIQSEAQEFRGDDGDVWVKRDDVLDVLDALAGEGS